MVDGRVGWYPTWSLNMPYLSLAGMISGTWLYVDHEKRGSFLLPDTDGLLWLTAGQITSFHLLCSSGHIRCQLVCGSQATMLDTTESRCLSLGPGLSYSGGCYSVQGSQ